MEADARMVGAASRAALVRLSSPDLQHRLMVKDSKVLLLPKGDTLKCMVPASPETLVPLAPQEQNVEAVAGVLHIYVAFDWGEEIDLDHARALVPAEVHEFPRRRRTPPSTGYRPPPLRFLLAPVALNLPELGHVQAAAEATVFDFAAVSMALHVPFRQPPESLSRLAGWLAEPTPLVQTARDALAPLHSKLLPAIQNPSWKGELSEEYFVFHLPPQEALLSPEQLLRERASWLASLVRLEAAALSPEETAEALRLFIRYHLTDLFICDWAAAFLLDQDCEETLQAIEFANLQLLEFRHIDDRLDGVLATAYGMIHYLAKSWLRFWRSHGRSLRFLGELKVEANGLFERTGNVLKLVGDQYLARVYRMLEGRFHLEQWEQSIQRKLEVAEGVYRVVSDQTDTYRAEFLEIVVVLLIILEVVLAFFHH